jgi:hypothetical protein
MLSAVLETAVEYDLVSLNAARGRRRRLPGTTPHRPFVQPEQLMALLDAAEEYHAGRGRPLVAVLAGAGLRIEEALSLQRQHVDLARGHLTVTKSKTEAHPGAPRGTRPLAGSLPAQAAHRSGVPDSAWSPRHTTERAHSAAGEGHQQGQREAGGGRYPADPTDLTARAEAHLRVAALCVRRRSGVRRVPAWSYRPDVHPAGVRAGGQASLEADASGAGRVRPRG